MRLYFIILSIIFGIFDSRGQERIYRYPDVSENQIVFSFADDLWVVNKTGGTAQKISSPSGVELFAKFSPDGQELAYCGNYDGNLDIYSMPVSGGVPKRLTFHGMSERMIDWLNDGSGIYFASSMYSGKQRWNQFYKIAISGGLAEKMPMEQAEFGSLSPDGTKIAFTYKSRVFRTWKRYKGGTAADIFIFDLTTFESENITNDIHNSEMPMWGKDAIYYISDAGAENRFNLWKYDLKSKNHQQLTHFKDFDIHFPSIGPKDIVFEAGGKLYLMNLSTEKYNEVQIELLSDYEKTKPRLVPVKSYLNHVHPSPDGKRVIVEARGELFDVPADKGAVINKTNRSGSHERYPAWSPDGKKIAYWSDKSGEYQLYIGDYHKSESRAITNFTSGFRYRIFWSPDSRKIAFVDQSMNIFFIEIDNGNLKKVDQGKWLFEGGLRDFEVNWSKDSKWLTYSRGLENRQHALFLYDIENEKRHQITSGFYNYTKPKFSRDGKYLCFLTNQNFDPEYSNFDNTWIYSNSEKIGLVPLSIDTKSPLLEVNDTVAYQEEDSKTEKKDTTLTEEKANKDKDLEVDLDHLERRMILLPITAGSFRDLDAVEGKIIYIRSEDSGKNKLQYFDLEAKAEETIVEDIHFFEVTADGKSLLTGKQNSMGVIPISKDQKIEKTLALDDMQIMLDPRAEWRQIFNEVWRIERDFFYDENMHGTDWNQLKMHYGKLIESAQTRTDVNYIIGELIGELNASHTYRGGGDNEDGKSVDVGYLGVDFGMKNGIYTIENIIEGAPWDKEVVSPLSQPGLKVKEGDYIFAVNGLSLTDFGDPYGAFAGLAEKTVELLVGSHPDKSDAHPIYVKPLSSETRLRNLAWIEQNRKYVEEKSGGKVGYVYVPSTGLDGQQELVRMFYGQHNKPGMIIDERWNNGGQIPDRFVELLNRPVLSYFDVRDGQNWSWPPVGHYGPKAMLINGWSGSGGDCFPDFFKRSNLGPLIGTRTWGGIIGISGAPDLIDGGSVTAPTFRMYHPDGTWFAEGHGVDPDIEIPEDPTALAKGQDPQLDAAIQNVLEQLKTSKPRIIPPPPVENRN